VVRGEARIDTLDAIWPQPGTDEGGELARIPDVAWAEAARLLDAGGWRLNRPPGSRLRAEDGTERWVVSGPLAGEQPVAAIRAGDAAHVDVDGRSIAFLVAPPPDVDRAAKAASAHAAGGGPAEVLAPMPGAVLAIHVAVGDDVAEGSPLITLEAMKMEHAASSPRAGRVTELLVRLGDQVVRGQLLATVET
jgi:biotin carboxyl carrier protein